MNSARGWKSGWLLLLIAGWVQAAPVETPSGSWLAQAQQELAQREYRASESDRGLQAPNRAQGFRTYFDTGGVSLVKRDVEAAPLVDVRLLEYGRSTSVHAPGAAEVVTDGAQVILRWADLEARYVNRDDGLAQELRLSQRPQGSKALSLVFALDGATARVDGNAVALSNHGQPIRWDRFAATDAEGRAFSVSLSVEQDRLTLSLDDQQARYPITIKSVLSGLADALLESNEANANLGLAVAGAGDVNGDGFADLIVGAYRFDNGQTDEGAAFVYFGGVGTFNVSADALLEANQMDSHFGISVAGAGDVNGDGFADVIVGAPRYDNGEVDEGAGFVYFGGAGVFNSIADARLEANQAGAILGTSVAGAGDINGDGYADVILGASLFGNGQTYEGAAFIYFGGAGAFNLNAAAQLESNQENAFLGGSVAGAGDVNGDGYADVAVGATAYDSDQSDEGAVFIYFGGAGAFDSTADAKLESNQSNTQFGYSVAGAGDVNGDGYADVIVGAFAYDNGQNNEGAAFLYLGGAGAFNLTAAALLEVNQANANFGESVAGAGDVNGDGYADVIVGASIYDNGQPDEGAAFVYFGGAGVFDLSADALLQSDQASARFGASVAGPGDINGDGFADVIVGAYSYDKLETDEGAAFVYFGGSGAFNLTADALLETNQANAKLGFSVAGAGDVNGDGYADVIVGAINFDSGQTNEGAAFIYFGGAGAFNATANAQLESNQAIAHLGTSVAGAGDVNGDGFADVIVGASLYDSEQTNEGAAFVYLGGAGDFDPTADARLESNQPDAEFGISVAGAGDINGDGFADVIVGAYLYDIDQADQGAAFVYFGGAGEFNSIADARLESNQANAKFGNSVAGAGDVNGDGYADVIVGAFNYDNDETDAGAAFVYFGGSVFNSGADAQLEAVPESAFFGTSVAGAGDVNGDGFADVIVGAYGYDNGPGDVGSAFLYFGGMGAFNLVADAQLQSDQLNSLFGLSVAGAGDVNGDGYADVIVGAREYDRGQSNEGAAFLYFGGAGSFNLTAAARLESNQANAFFGGSVAGAGDVNGDGFADVIVGAFFYDEGAAFLYYGTTRGRPVLASQFRGNGSTPVQPWGLSQQADGFVVAIEATSPRGRERARLQVEACPNGAPFGSLLCEIRSTISWTEIGANPQGSTLALSLTGLTSNRVYRWRARVLYAPLTITSAGITSPPKPPAGPWRRLYANADVADIRNGVSNANLIFANGFE